MAYFEEYCKYRSTSVFDGGRLVVGDEVTGPAIVEEPTITIVVFPGASLTLRRPTLNVMTVGSSPASDPVLALAGERSREVHPSVAGP